jgi:dihydroorotate dehydrogenase electron transfer subunit
MPGFGGRARRERDEVIRQKCEVLSAKRWGVYHSITLVAPDMADQARPGQFVQIAMPAGRDILLRRPFSIHQASRKGGWAGTLEIAFIPVGPGSEWLAHVEAHDFLDVVGPLGRPFPYPREPVNCMLVGGGYGAAPLYFLAQELREKGKRVDMVVGARTQERVFKPIEAKRLSVAVAVTTDDGSLGERGKVTDVLPGMITRCESQVVYACGPNPMLRAVAEYCTEQGIPSQVAVEELMACGMGVCWTCVVPVIWRDGKGWNYQRSCVEGPVFSGARVWWEKWLGGKSAPIQTPPHGFQMEELAAGRAASWQAE